MLRELRLAAARRVNFTMRKRLNGRRYRVPVLAGVGARLRHDYEPLMVPLLVDLNGMPPAVSWTWA